VVLDWNEPARKFYRKLGAKEFPEWLRCRLCDGEIRQALIAFKSLANQGVT
jgi:hypothetical protein